MTNTFYMLAGLPGSGKSWQAKRIIEKYNRASHGDDIHRTISWISSDAVREELYGAEEVQGDSAEVFAEMKRRTDAALRAGSDVIYDACNINSKRRRGILNSLGYFKVRKVCIVCATPYDECIRRNSLRDRVVPDEVIKRMYMHWNTPYFFEGWDDIILSYSDTAENSLGDPKAFVSLCMDLAQDNPNHRETLGEHVSRTKDEVVRSTGLMEEDNLVIAAMIHDCGKPFTKAFTNSKGEETDVAHYYQHACVGAYDAMFFDYKEKTARDVLEICTLINLHMNPFSWDKEATIAKQAKLMGTDLVDKLMILHKADEASSICV